MKRHVRFPSAGIEDVSDLELGKLETNDLAGTQLVGACGSSGTPNPFSAIRMISLNSIAPY